MSHQKLPVRKTTKRNVAKIERVTEYDPTKTLIEFKITVDINVNITKIVTEEHEEKKEN